MDPNWPAYLILFAAGGIAGTLNVIAGGGSFLTLPLMIFLGLPPTVANGTNRVAILVQNVGAVWSFHQHRLIRWNWLALTALPSLGGAALGVWAAVVIDDRAFQRALAAIMVAAALWTLWDPLKRHAVSDHLGEPGRLGQAGLALGFFVVGLYGGFVQAGVGFLIIAVVTLAGLNLVSGNALKVLVVLTYTPLTLLLFGLNGKVNWGMGAALATGSLLGGLLGVRLIVLRGHTWVKRIVTVAVVLFAIKLWLSP